MGSGILKPGVDAMISATPLFHIFIAGDIDCRFIVRPPLISFIQPVMNVGGSPVVCTRQPRQFFPSPNRGARTDQAHLGRLD